MGAILAGCDSESSGVKIRRGTIRVSEKDPNQGKIGVKEETEAIVVMIGEETVDRDVGDQDLVTDRKTAPDHRPISTPKRLIRFKRTIHKIEMKIAAKILTNPQTIIIVMQIDKRGIPPHHNKVRGEIIDETLQEVELEIELVETIEEVEGTLMNKVGVVRLTTTVKEELLILEAIREVFHRQQLLLHAATTKTIQQEMREMQEIIIGTVMVEE